MSKHDAQASSSTASASTRAAPAAGATRAHKRVKIQLQELGAGHYISLAGKSAVLQALKDMKINTEDLQGVSRRRIALARKEAADRDTSFGKCIITRTFQTKSGPKDYPVQNPLAMLHIAMLESPRYSDYVREAIRKRGLPTLEAPWKVLIYIDEITCGNPLAVRADAKRKIQGVYWSLYDLGAEALCDESAWFELTAFRSSETSVFVGSVSHLLEVCLSCFYPPDNNLHYGVLFAVSGYGNLMLIVEIEHLIADVKALIEVSGAMGVSAIMPCWFCRKVLSFSAKLKPEMAALPDFVDVGCLDAARWGKHTDASLLQLLQELKHASTTLIPAMMKRKQTLCGYKHIENNLLLAVPRPIKLLCLDWMHLIFQSGNFNRELFRILRKATTRTFHAYRAMTQYVSAYHYPAAIALRPNLLCDAHWEACKDGDAQVFKCSASEGLTLYAVLCKFFEGIVLPHFNGSADHALLVAMVKSYSLLCDVVDLLQLCKFGVKVSPDLLEKKIDAWALAHRAAYGTDCWFLKNHLTMHLADIVREREADDEETSIFACWLLDRNVYAIYKCTADLVWLHAEICCCDI